jgi:hypothetical protein
VEITGSARKNSIRQEQIVMKTHFCSTGIVLVCFMCGNVPIRADSITVGVWNIEALSRTATRGFPEQSGIPPRTAADLQKIADYIEDELGVDALMVSEIEPDAPESTASRPQSAQLNVICDHLGPNWKYFLGRTGDKMRLGLLFNTEKIRLKKLVNLTAGRFLVSGKDVLDRDPFIAWITALENGQTKNDLLLVCVHLKSQQRPFRNNRMAAMAKLIGDITDKKVRAALTLPSAREEPEVLILGDCNDSSFKSTGFKYMFDYLDGVGFTHITPDSGDYPHTRINGSQIDHVFGSKRFIQDSLVSGSFAVHTVPPSERYAYRKTFSDHFPVTVDVRVESDTDFSLEETLAIENDVDRANRLSNLTEEIRARLSPAAESVPEDDEDNEPIVVEAEIIDDGFERILAPHRPADGVRDLVEAVETMVPPTSAPDAMGEQPAPSPLWTAIELVQAEIKACLTRGEPLTADEANRIENLLEAERELVRVLIRRP